jgi:membrane protease YdiL (CAAX protease family)
VGTYHELWGARRSTRPPSVSPAAALLTLVALAIVVLLTEWVARRLEAYAGGHLDDLTGWDIALAVVEHVLIVAAALIPARLLLGRIRASDFGLRRVPWRPAIASAAVIYGAYLVLAALLFAIVGAPPVRASANALADTDSAGVLIAYALIACVLVPPTEELLFRGLLFGALRGRLGFIPAALVAGGLFGAVHGPPLGSMLDLALLGVALCVLYERTGSLLPCIAVHAVHNGIAFGAVASLSPLATIALTIAAVLIALAATRALAAAMHERGASPRLAG